MAEPDDVFTIQAVEMATSKTVVPRVITLGQVERVLDRLYGEGQSALAHIAEEIEGNDESSGADTIERLKDLGYL